MKRLPVFLFAAMMLAACSDDNNQVQNTTLQDLNLKGKVKHMTEAAYDSYNSDKVQPFDAHRLLDVQIEQTAADEHETGFYHYLLGEGDMMNFTTEYFFNERGLATEIRYHFGSEPVEIVNRMEYDDKNRETWLEQINAQGEVQTTISMVFDGKGNEIRRVNADPQSGDTTITEWVYDKRGNRLRETTRRDDEVTWDETWEYAYGSRHKDDRVVRNDVRSGGHIVTLYEYDDNKNMTSQTKQQNGKFWDKHLFKYNADGTMAASASVDDNGDTLSYTTYEYDEAGRIVYQAQFNRGAEVGEYRISKRYDDKGNEVFSEYYGEVDHHVSNIEYDEEGRDVKNTYYDYVTSIESQTVTKYYAGEYAAKDDVEEILTYKRITDNPGAEDDDNEFKLVMQVVCQYDDHGNQVRRETYYFAADGEAVLTEMTEREMEYYE